MTSNELWRRTAKKSSVTILDTSEILKNAFEVIKEGLLEDGAVKIDGFGTFKIRHHKGKTGINTKGEPCVRKSKNKIKFEIYKELEEKIQDLNIVKLKG